VKKRRNTSLCAAEANKKQNSKKKIFRYGLASILSTISNLVFLFHPFMAATKLTNPTTWLLLYSCRVHKQHTCSFVSQHKHEITVRWNKTEFLLDETVPSEHTQSPANSKPVWLW
jgi:hypothetical protein